MNVFSYILSIISEKPWSLTGHLDTELAEAASGYVAGFLSELPETEALWDAAMHTLL